MIKDELPINSVVKHRADQQRFSVEFDGQEAYVDYRRKGAGVHFVSTYVPTMLRGKGLAKILVEAALAWAEQEELTISSSCWYVDKFLG